MTTIGEAVLKRLDALEGIVADLRPGSPTPIVDELEVSVQEIRFKYG